MSRPVVAAQVAAGDISIYRLPVVRVEVAKLNSTGSPRLSGENAEHVQVLLAAQTPLPPIVVHRPTMRIIDGVHRVRAAIRRGERTIAARLFEGDDVAAFVLAVRLNVTHGLPLPLADRKAAAERIIASHPEWSDRRVASVTGISPGTVADIRRRASGGVAGPPGRVGQDGRVRPLDVGDGRRRAGQLLRENPHLSLRQVARAAEISPETVRDVRNRLRDGKDPVPAYGRRQARADESGARRSRIAAEHEPHALPPGRTGDRAWTVNHLRSDPALRYSETGRNLLRLLSLHAQWTEEWESILEHLPPHCTGAVADLARQFADLWADCATRVAPEQTGARPDRTPSRFTA